KPYSVFTACVMRFQSLLHQGNTSNMKHAVLPHQTGDLVSIPSSSGQYFQPKGALFTCVIARTLPFQSLLHQVNTSNGVRRCTLAHLLRRLGFNPFFIRAILPTASYDDPVCPEMAAFQSLLHQGNTSNCCFSK